MEGIGLWDYWIIHYFPKGRIFIPIAFLFSYIDVLFKNYSLLCCWNQLLIKRKRWTISVLTWLRTVWKVYMGKEQLVRFWPWILYLLTACTWQLACFLHCYSFAHACALFSQSDCWLTVFLICFSSTTCCKCGRGFCSWSGLLQMQILVSLYRCLMLSVNCDIKIFLCQFPSIIRLQLPLPVPEREKHLMQCFFKESCSCWVDGVTFSSVQVSTFGFMTTAYVAPRLLLPSTPQPPVHRPYTVCPFSPGPKARRTGCYSSCYSLWILLRKDVSQGKNLVKHSYSFLNFLYFPKNPRSQKPFFKRKM